MRAVETGGIVERALRRHEQGQPEAAEPLLVALIRRFPRHQAARLALGRILEESGRGAEATRHYQAVVATDPTNPKAVEALQRLVEGSGGSMSVPEGLAQAEVAWREGRGTEVEPVLASLAASHPNLVRVQLMLGDLKLRAGDWIEGAKRFHAARELDPSMEVARSPFVAKGLSPEYQATAPTVSPAEEVEPAVQGGDRDGAAGAVEPEPAERVPSPEPASVPVEEHPDLPILPEIAEPEISPLGNGAGGGELSSSLAIVSSRARLGAAFGEEGRMAITEGLSALAAAARRGSGIDAHLVLVDDPQSLGELGLSVADPEDPASIAKLLADLEVRLGETGQRADYLLLVGGDGIVPFFRIPNPSDDGDEEVFTDAPYASRTGNYLLPDRAVGRIPDLGSSEALTEFIVRTATAHRKRRRRGGRLGRLFSGNGSKPLAVSAGVWRDASSAVMQALGDGRGLEVSPPFSDQEFLEAYDRIPALAYFNLHGVAGSPYWYGHGSSDEEDAPVFPIALTPLNLSWADPTEAVVFSEACYGAEIADRGIQDSVALAFLAAGARGFIGSTGMAYGSLAPPLVGADLLAVNLFLGLREGFALGEALRRAKLGLIEQAGAEQGYLDAEDQKTLLTFVLYGDPSLGLSATHRIRRRGMGDSDPVQCPAVICGHGGSSEEAEAPTSIRRTLQSYLSGQVPALASAKASVKKVSACGCGDCPICPVRTGSAADSSPPTERWVASAEHRTPLEVDPRRRSLRHRAVLTSDGDGRIGKLVVSR